MSAGVARTLLVILDGWGVRTASDGNAIACARTPAYDALLRDFPHTTLAASGEDVGLPAGRMGNSEVGHLNLGAGRVVEQDLVRIDRGIGDGSLFAHAALQALLARLRGRGATLHLMGLLSDGGVHSMDQHLYALLDLLRGERLERVAVHAFLDGRDTPPRSGLGYVLTLEARLAALGIGRIQSIAGRYYAMDRDHRWPRTELAYRAIVEWRGREVESAADGVRASYGKDLSDEFLVPAVVRAPGGLPKPIADGDGVLFFNFRADRARQLTEAIIAEPFAGFARPVRPRIDMLTMSQYDADFGLPALLAPLRFDHILADVLAGCGATNLRVAETEKYAHVTYFFNGGRETPWPGEARHLVPSPRVATYDLEPAMNARGVTDAIIEAMARGEAPVVISNYANADMVGHTGLFDPTVQAVEVLDSCLGRLVAAADDHGYILFVTADHGNAELMVDPVTGEPHTAHTTNPVPFIMRAPGLAGRLASGGRLADVAPTLLDLWGIGQPAEMTGVSLLRR